MAGDARIIDQNPQTEIVAASVIKGSGGKRNALVVALMNVSGDIYNAGGGAVGSGGDGAINDGADSGIKASVKNTSGAKPLHVIITNVSGDTPNLPSSNPDGSIVDGADAGIKATVKDYGNANPLTVVLVNVSGDAYNGNDISVVVNKWNLKPTEDSVHIHSGILGVSGDVSTTPKAGQTWPVELAGTLGVQIIGSNVGSASGDTYVNQRGAWATAVTGDVSTMPKAGSTWPVTFSGTTGVNVIGGAVGGTVGISGDQLNVNQKGAWAVAVTGDVSTTPKDGNVWPTSQQSVIGANIVGGSIGGRFSISGDQINVIHQGVVGVQVVGGQVGGSHGVSGDVSVKPGTIPAGQNFPVSGDTGIRDGVDPTIKGTVRDYTNSNPLAVALTNVSGDTYNPFPKSRILITAAGRITSAGSNTIVAAAGGRKIKVTAYDLQGDGNNARGYFASGASGTQLTPEWELQSLDGVAKQVGGVDGTYIFATTAGDLLSFESSSTKPMKYSVTYHTEDAN